MDTSGYGQVRWNGKQVQVHRLVWEWVHGPIPDKMVLDHVECRNRRCANVDHLRLVTKRVNDTENRIHASSARTHCPKNHPYDAENTIITKRGWRVCRECNKERCRKTRAQS